MKQLKRVFAYVKAMDKKQRKRTALAVGAAALILLLAVLPVLAAGRSEEDGPQASVLSGTVTRGDITTEIHGGGTLAEEDAVGIRLPTGVMITEFYVENYAEVKQGDALAGVDRVSVMTAVSSVQETLDYLKEQIADSSAGTVSVRISNPTAGRVKAVYAQKGDDVAAVMSEHGALAVISLDGLMAVEFDTTASLVAGDKVWVGFADGTDVLGRVESSLNGTVIVTVDDHSYPIGAQVTITDSDDDKLGSGTLYVHNAWNAVAWSGTVSAVSITENTDISAGRTILTLQGVNNSAEMETLSILHREYEQLMLELFVMYQAQALLAPCDGVVSGVDKNSVHLLADSGASYTVSLLANAPNGDDETGYTNFVGRVAIANGSGWSVQMNPTPFAVADYLDLSEVDLSTEAMTEAVNFTFTAPIYELREGAWVQLQASEVMADDIMLFAADSSGECVWMVRVQKAESAPEVTPEVSPEVSPTPDGAEDTTDTSPTPEQDSGQTQRPGGSIGGGAASGGGSAAEESFDLFEPEGTDILFVTPQDTMTMSITVDEQDIGKLFVGRTAEVAVDVLKGETFIAEVTEVGVTGTSDGGNSKYTVELTLPRGEKMLAGMNATASFAAAATENVLVIPVAALAESGSDTVVYTKRSGDNLSAPVSVTTGVSDGEFVEILSGLEEGDSFFYSYYDTPEIDNVAS